MTPRVALRSSSRGHQSIAFYQLGYGIAAFDVGPLVDRGVELSTIYAFAALTATAMGAWSFVVARRRPAPASIRPVPG